MRIACPKHTTIASRRGPRPLPVAARRAALPDGVPLCLDHFQLVRKLGRAARFRQEIDQRNDQLVEAIDFLAKRADFQLVDRDLLVEREALEIHA